MVQKEISEALCYITDRNDAGIRNKRKTAGAGIPGLLLVFWIGMPRRFVPGKKR